MSKVYDVFNKLRNHAYIKNAIFVVTFMVSGYGIFLMFYRAFQGSDIPDRILATIFYFTSQSNLLVFIVLLLYVMKMNENRWYHVLSFIALFDIIITGLVFNTLLRTGMSELTFLQDVLHTIVPVFYTIFFFTNISYQPKKYDYFYTWIHLSLYLLLVYLVIHPFYADIMSLIFPEVTDYTYVYPFLNPANYPFGIVGLSVAMFIVVAPLMTSIAYILKRLKSMIEASNDKKKEA